MADALTTNPGSTSSLPATTTGMSVPISSMPRVEGQRDPVGAAVCTRYEKAKGLWDRWRPLWQDIYDLCLPQRRGFQITTEGRRNTLQIFDETAVTGVQEFASRVATTMMPPYMRWVDLRSGPDAPADMKSQLDESLALVTDEVFNIINQSNFNTQVTEAITEMAMSTGTLIIEDDPIKFIRCAAVPLTRVVLDAGPFGEVDFWSRISKKRLGTVMIDYPTVQFPVELQHDLKMNPDREIELIEATWRDWQFPFEEVYRWAVVWKEQQVTLAGHTFSGIGSNPWISFAWNKDPYETYGRGPLINAISAIKTCNLTVQLTLENAELAITGMWQYDDDSVIDVDNIQFIPNSMIAREANSRGLEQLKTPGDFNVSNLVLQDMRENIKKALYIGQFAPLGKTPQSATEVSLRQQDLATRIGSSWGRLNFELVQAVVRRVVFLLRRQGRIKIPLVNGRQVAITPISPLQRQQNQEDILAITSFLQEVGTLFGPNTIPIVTDPMEGARELGRLHGVPPKILRSPDEQGAVMQQLQTMAQQAAQAGPGGAASQPGQAAAPG